MVSWVRGKKKNAKQKRRERYELKRRLQHAYMNIASCKEGKTHKANKAIDKVDKLPLPPRNKLLRLLGG